MKELGRLIILALLIIFLETPPLAKSNYHHPMNPPEIGLDEKLGESVPLRLTFYDENSNSVDLRQLINKPTIVSLVYYRCPDVCPLLLSGITDVLDRLQLKPGRDYSVLTISFDDTDTSEASLEKKKNYLAALEKPFPEGSWRFLTGDKDNIRKFTDAVGFKFKREGEGFLHPVSLIILSSNGKIIRYLTGVTFLPFDLKMALIEASSERVGSTIGKVLLYCFSYDPKGRKYVFNIMKVSGTVILFFLITFFVYLALKGRRATGK